MAQQLYMRNGKWVNLAKAQEMRKGKTTEEVEPVMKAKTVNVEEKSVIEKKTEEVVNEETTTEEVELTLDELKKLADEKGIKYHHASGIKKLKELLQL